VAPGATGEHFPEQTPEALVAAMETFDPDAYDPAAIREHAMQWGHERFRERVREAVLDVARGPRPG
jgi:hypothetical protein